MSRSRWTIATALILVHAATGEVLAQEAVKKEPAMGAMKPGERLLVDDGSCGPGKIKEVIGGDHVAVGGKGHVVRQRRCISR
jgi:hypothetical protein